MAIHVFFRNLERCYEIGFELCVAVRTSVISFKWPVNRPSVVFLITSSAMSRRDSISVLGITDEKSQALLAEYDEKFYGENFSDDPASSDDSDDHVAQPAAKCLCLNDVIDDEQYSDEDIDVSHDQSFDRDCQP